MASEFKLENGKFTEMEDGDVINTYDTICSYLEKEFSTVSAVVMNLTNYTNAHSNPNDRKKLKSKVQEKICALADTKFGKKVIHDEDIAKFHEEMEKMSEESGDELYNVIHNFIDSKLKKTSKTGGDKMFKTLKEAKLFTAHLDSLANEIQGMEDISDEMRTHLAYRIDKLSDLIESTAAKKEASVQKEANGMGHGAWAYDQDEARYMGTMGGTGALQHDADEAYMEHFKGDDHMEVLKRQEPANIMGAGAKVQQPSDNYDEQEVADKLRLVVKKMMAKTE
jgi:hypothetical protein